MKECVLDTHALFWHIARPRRLGQAAHRLFRDVEAGRCRGWVPAAVLVEATLASERGRSRIGLFEVEATLDRNDAFQVLPLDRVQVREFAGLATIRDPFDRLIVAAARSKGCPLVSADEAIAKGGLVQVVWD